MTSVHLHHLALRVADLARAAAFYVDLLELRELRRLDGPDGLRAIWVDAGGGVVLMLERALRGTGAASGSAHVLAFAIDDLARWEALLAAAGVAIDDRTGATLYVRDPDGHRVGLSVHVF